MGKPTYIEINGKKYDAATGKMFTGQQSTVIKPTATVKHGIGSVDGFARRAVRAQKVAAHTQKAPQRSQTLMRKGLRKPVASAVKHRKTTTIQRPAISKSSLGVSARRQNAAKAITKSPQVRKFDHSTASRSTVVKKAMAITPKPAPSHVAKKIQTATIETSRQHTGKHSETSRQASVRMIEKALETATSHTEQTMAHAKQTTKKRTSKLRKKLGVSKRALSLGSGALAVVLLAGFFAVQNVPNLSMRVAATRAGFDASMPDYQPAGFSFDGPIDYNAGRVTVSFKSNSDERTYSLTQRSSNWTSDALLANFIESEEKQYQTFLDKGRTLYLYDGSNATWIDNGIWYQIEGDSDLTTDQLVRIASSI